jgi:plastocyanin
MGMQRVASKFAILLALSALVLLAAVRGIAAAESTGQPKQVDGSVGPGFVIKLTKGGKAVTTLKAGVQYRFVINDKAAIHDFHLTGPGVNKVITSVPFTGSKSVVMTLKKGNYRFVCDPHASSMSGGFNVG